MPSMSAEESIPSLDGRSTPSDDKLIEPLREVAEYLNVKDRTIYRVVAKREISGFEVGGSWWFRKSEIDQWTAGNAVGLDDIGEPVERKQ